ncbi:MAG: FG-GAP repeat domain-containing protein, partial [Polyangiaceae bacterium]
GDGKGNFVYETTVNDVGSPTGMDVGDFNNDHKQDIVVVTSAASYVALGKGDGTFQAAVTLSGPPAAGSALVRQADFNQDGWADLAIGNNNGLYVLLNDQTGHFPTANEISVTHAPDNRFAVGDINGDTLPDIGFGNNDLYLALSGGDAGAFSIVEVPSAVARYVAFGNLNGSGPPDIVSTDTGNTPIYVAVQRANGTLIPQVSYETGSQSRITPVIGDFDNAGNLDVFVGIPNGSSSTAELWHGNGDGTLAPPIEYPLPNPPLFLLMGDVTNDGKLDVVSVGSGAGIIATTLVQ